MELFPEYICPHCGESIQIVVDPSGFQGAGSRGAFRGAFPGALQQYIEDCPVCCSPNRLEIRLESDGEVVVDAQAE